MSGYRSLHREQVESTAIWDVATSPLLMPKSQYLDAPNYRIFTASADGLVRAYHAKEKSMQDKDALDASALNMTCTHVLLGQTQEYVDPPPATALGCTRVCVARNYIGDDDTAGDLVVASLELSGVVRIYLLSETLDADATTSSSESKEPALVRASYEFSLENATGTMLALCPPNCWSTIHNGDVLVAVACLDGTVAIVATGIQTPQRLETSKPKEPTPAGTVVDRLGSQGSSVPMSISCHPTNPLMAIGRDGQIDVLASSSATQQYRRHRILLPGLDANQHGSIVRTVAYTPDGSLLCAGNDGGSLAVWDVSGPSHLPPQLAHHTVEAHDSWVLALAGLPDSRRMVSCSANRKLNVWRFNEMYQPVHVFDSDQTVWTLAVQQNETADKKINTRLVAGTETGWLQILSLDGK